MNPHYARLVTLAAVSATAVALVLFVMKVFAWWHTGSV
ncbi:CDF family cation-efflux transporter FieF, partial [Pectobacterium parmentieri]